jgi:hypothetical protein
MAVTLKNAQKSGAELVAEAARRALEDADGDVRTAAEMLERAVRMESPLRDALTDPLISGACWQAVSQQHRERRRQIWNTPKPVPVATAKQTAEQSARVVQLAAGTLSMFPLPGGKRLSEATRSEVVAASDFYAQRASDAGHKARWLQLVAQSIPDGKKAGDVLTDERLAELQTEASRAK